MEPARAQDAATGPPPRPDDQVRVAGWVDQVVRREAFEAAHPDVKIQAHTPGQPWTALVPMPDGSEVTVTDLGSWPVCSTSWSCWLPRKAPSGSREAAGDSSGREACFR